MPSSLVLKLYKPFILALRPHKIEMDLGFILQFGIIFCDLWKRIQIKDLLSILHRINKI